MKKLSTVLTLALMAPGAMATETENLAFGVLPVTSTVTVDGDAADWNLVGGIFSCTDVENQRERYAFWAHAGWDKDNLYLLLRFVDSTPLNNPRQVEAGMGFVGDSLQVRVIAGDDGNPDTGRLSHWTGWQGPDGKGILDATYGAGFNKGSLKDALPKGAKQAFKKDADGKGYCQEVAIPWALIANPDFKPGANQKIKMTFENNFTVGVSGRLSVKDLFVADKPIDRVFTFANNSSWGTAVLLAEAPAKPAPLRLSDHRQFAISMVDGKPAIDWNGLIIQKTLAGHKAIDFEMPFDGYISLNLYAADGTVARQLLNGAFYTKGKQQVLWDGLTTFSWRNPGDPVPVGTYTWKALVHPGLDLKLTGWADNSGSAPWDGASGKDNWGGDHGKPISTTTIGDTVLMGWTGAEAGSALLACDLNGKVKWKNSRGACNDIASDGGMVYYVGDERSISRMALADGGFVAWPGEDSVDISLHDVLDEAQRKNVPNRINAVAARDGHLFLANTDGNLVAVLDGVSGKLTKTISVPGPVALATSADGVLFVASRSSIVAVDVASGKTKPFATIGDIWGLTSGPDGELYVAVHGERQQVVVFDKKGKEVRAIGRRGGRAITGKWDTGVMINPEGISVDNAGKLWVAENLANPKRFSVWDTKTGVFDREFFGPTSYGATGGAISSRNPRIMAGSGSEWQLDATTGLASCLGVIRADGFQCSRFAIGSNGREYLASTAASVFGLGPMQIHEHTGPGEWKLRSAVLYRDKDGNGLNLSEGGRAPGGSSTVLWADRNGDEKQDADEMGPVIPGVFKMSSWYMNMTPDLTMYSGKRQFRCTGFTACGAPTYDLDKPTTMPAAGLGSADGTSILQDSAYGESYARFTCYDLTTGKERWWYPSTFVGVHGSHRAPPAEVGLIRGAYEVCSAIKLPAPIGNAWAISTNCGEWHILTEQGFYLSRLFQPDQLKVVFPDPAVPGAMMNDATCGGGSEDFGGNATVTDDGKLYVQVGKTGFWNVEVANIDQVKEVIGTSVTISQPDLAIAKNFKEQALAAALGQKKLIIHRAKPTFTGDLAKDFPNATPQTFEKGLGTKVTTVMSWDEGHLYVGWNVLDRTPWINGARTGDALYWGGDTVDLQLGSSDNVDRNQAIKGDVRISIGNLIGKDIAQLFEAISDKKHPATFSSGVIKAYTMDNVVPLANTQITVTKTTEGYVVEAAIPTAELGITPKAGLTLRGDLGVTFGDQAGNRTRLRSYWSSQHTGLVDDIVFELQMEPNHWGELSFVE